MESCVYHFRIESAVYELKRYKAVRKLKFSVSALVKWYQVFLYTIIYSF